MHSRCDLARWFVTHKWCSLARSCVIHSLFDVARSCVVHTWCGSFMWYCGAWVVWCDCEIEKFTYSAQHSDMVRTRKWIYQPPHPGETHCQYHFSQNRYPLLVLQTLLAENEGGAQSPVRKVGSVRWVFSTYRKKEHKSRFLRSATKWSPGGGLLQESTIKMGGVLGAR